MIILPTNFEGLKIIEMQVNKDDRGNFARAYCKEEFADAGIFYDFVQDNISQNTRKNTIRGMHWQREPYTDAKIVRCITGSILDVVVDIRANSPTYLKWYGINLSEHNGVALFIPKGFAHGFQTLCDNSTVYYKVSDSYCKESGCGLRYDDPKIGIKWERMDCDITISYQDLKWRLI